MGKAATLNAVRGDVMIPTVVQDEHSHNTYLFDNCFSAADVAPYLIYGTVLDNQKARLRAGHLPAKCADHGRLLQRRLRRYRDGGRALSYPRCTKCSAPNATPWTRSSTSTTCPSTWASCTTPPIRPLGKGKNLGAGTLSYFGMDSTYATALAILRRIFQKERERSQ